MKKFIAFILSLAILTGCMAAVLAEDPATGTRFSVNEGYHTVNSVTGLPLTWEADIEVDADAPSTVLGTVAGSYKADGTDGADLRITEGGHPQLFLQDGSAYKTFTFDEVSLIGLGRVKLTVVWDKTEQVAKCYLDGALKQVIVTPKNEIWNGKSTKPIFGNGSEEDPYLITNGAELWYVLGSSASLGSDKYYKLTNDIYLNDVSADNWYESDSNKAWRTGTAFSGHIDGDGHIVYGIWYSANSYWAGLIPYMSGGSVKDLGIAKSYITGTYAGAIVGQSVPSTDVTIDGCFSDDSVYVIGEKNASGIIGYIQNPSGSTALLTLSNCYTKASLSGKTLSGMFGAWAANYSIHGCFSYGAALYNGSASTSGSGAVYDNYASAGSAGTILTTSEMQGGAAAENMSALDFENYFEAVYSNTPELKAFADYDAPIPVWDGKSTKPTFGDGSKENPYLITNGAELWYVLGSSASLGSDKYYKVTNDIRLNDVSADNWYESDSNKAWRTGTAFSGHIDGDGHIIYGIWYSASSYWAGLIPYMSGGSVKDLGVARSYITGTYAGAIVGQSVPSTDVTIDGCFSDETVSVIGSKNAGGIVGYVQNPTNSTALLTVSNCYTKASLSGAGALNGILGPYNAYYSICGCYTFGSSIYRGNTSYAGKEAIHDNYATTGFAGTILDGENMKGAAASANMSALDFENYFETVSGNTPRLKAFADYDGAAVTEVDPQPDSIFAVGGDLTAGNKNYLRSAKLYGLATFSDLRTDSEISADLSDIDTADEALIFCYDMSSGGKNLIPDLSAKGNDLVAYDATKIGNYVTEENTGALNRVPYNNSEITADLGIGLWASPAVMDMNGDGYNDLVVSGNGVPYSGVYVFYGNAASSDSTNDGYLLMEKGRYLTVGHGNFAGSYLYDENGNYKDTVLTAGASIFTDFRNDQTKVTSFPTLTLPETIEGEVANSPYHNFYTLVDINGDGLLDAVRSYSSWKEYGWAGKFTSEGEWGSDGDGDPLHAWILWAENTSENNIQSASYGELQAVMVKTADGSQKHLDIYGTSSSARFVDMDGDKDLDIIYSTLLDEIFYFENISDLEGSNLNSEGVFLCAEGRNLMLADGDKTSDLVALKVEQFMPALADFDWNSDGFTDLIVGEEEGRVSLLENTGKFDENGAPIFLAPKYFKTSTDSLKSGSSFSTPFSVDWDGDGDEDIISGNASGFITFIENVTPKGGDLTNPSWNDPVRLTDQNGNVIRYQAGYNGAVQGPAEAKNGYSVVSVSDWDGDGILDIMANNVFGRVEWYKGINGETLKVEAARAVEVEWTDGAKYPSYNWWAPEGNELCTYWRTTPYMVDLFGDGLTDLVICDHEGYMAYFERYEDNGVLKLREGQRIFLDENSEPIVLATGTGLNNGANRQKFVLTDWNGDGMLDFIRNDATSVCYYVNVSEDRNGFVFRESGTMHDRRIAYHTTSPSVCDWNGDGSPDLLVGAEDGHFYYLDRAFAEISGDANSDGEVDILDLVTVAGVIEGKELEYDMNTADVNGDTVLDASDLKEIRKYIIH